MKAEPERSCAGCRERSPKERLLRIVRGPDAVAVDPTGKAQGRGAYVHPRRACVELALRRGGLARALRRPLGREDLATLRDEIDKELERT